jgi:hypothetical protein
MELSTRDANGATAAEKQLQVYFMETHGSAGTPEIYQRWAWWR